MWRIWFFFGILKISFAAPVETSQEDIIPSSELAVLKCLLSSPLNTCDEVKRSAEKIPKRIQKLYEKLKRPLLNTTNHELLDSTSLDTLPASLLYLIPKVRLSSMTGFTASNIIRKFPFDDALTMKILGLLTDKTSIKNFLNGLAEREEVFFVSDDEIIEQETIDEIAPISPAVEKEIALALSRMFPNGSQWEYWLYKASMISGTPILASLPNYFLNSLSLEATEKFLFHLRNWRWDHSKFYDYSWSQHSMSIKRIWSSIVVNKAEPPYRWTPKILRQFGFFLVGATPDELSQLSTDLRISHDFKLLLDLNWNDLQARAVFDVGFSDLNDLNENNLDSVRNILVYLLPRQIQQFSYNVTDFGNVKTSSGISLPTEKQMFFFHMAHLFSKDKEKQFSPTFWADHVSGAGNFYHLLPSSSLEIFRNKSFNVESLAPADSQYLSFRQAFYLSSSGEGINLLKPETVLKFKGLLKSVPSSKITEIPSNVISQNVKEHLLMFSSGESLPFTASILNKIQQDLVQTSYLEKMLYNKDFRQYFNLLSSRIIHKFKGISSNIFEVVNKNPVLERNVRLLPTSTLSSLLSLHRQEAIKKDGGWTYDNLVESQLRLYISGLSCADIEILETSDFMPVIGYYVQQMRAMHEMFPKNMQYCSLKALTKFLKLKASLRGLTSEHVGLLDLLEQHEIRAVGGYILAGLPIDIITTLGNKYNIILEIGKLTIPELMTALPYENIKEITNLFISNFNKIDLRVLTNMGNLVWFLDEAKIQKINVNDFKLFLESLEEDAGKTLCLNERERNSWKQLLTRAFGKPDSWSSGILSYLGDLLFVFDWYELERINKTSWTEVADVAVKTSSFYKLLQWPGKSKPLYFYEACLDILKIPERISYKMSVKQLFRFYLESAQYLLDTVQDVQHILKLNEEPNLVENAQSMGLPFNKDTFLHPPSKDTTPTSDINKKLTKTDDSAEYYTFDDYDSEEEYDDVNKFSDKVISDSQSLPTENKHSKIKSQILIPSKSYDEDILTSEQTNSKTSPSSESGPGHLSDFVSTNTPESEIKSFHSSPTENPLNLDGNILMEKRSSESSTQKDFLSESDDLNIFTSKSTKSLEQLKEELQRNASRALIIEVPLNQSEFLNTKTSTKHHIKVSCDAIKMLGKPGGLILDKEDFEKMDDTELEDCSEVIGTLDLDNKVKNYVWGRLKKWKESGNLMEVGSLVSAIGENDLSKVPLRLTEPWALENLKMLSTHITETDTMSFITDQFFLKNMDLQGLTYESAISLDRLVCTMTLSHQKKYLLAYPDVFISVAKTLGENLHCNSMIYKSCIKQLASIAVSQEAFGETHMWDANDVSDLGVIVAGLKTSDWQEKDGMGLRAEAFAGLTPAAVSCIPPDVFKVLSKEQLSQIPALSAAVISTEQTSSLSPSQYEIIDRVRRQIPPVDLTSSMSSSVSKVNPSYYFTVSATLFITYTVTSRTLFYL